MTESAVPFEAEQPAAQHEKRPPANAWIVSGYKFRRHPTLDRAHDEAERLRRQFPYKTFRIYRVKGTLVPSDASEKIAELQQLVARLTDFLTDEGGGDLTGGALNELRRRCANAVPLAMCPDWLHDYRDAEGRQHPRRQSRARF